MRVLSLCGPCAAGQCTGPGFGGICEHDCHLSLAEAHRRTQEVLVMLAAPEADRVRDLLSAAVRDGDAEAVRREGHQWSGHIGLEILRLADRVELDALRKERITLDVQQNTE